MARALAKAVVVEIVVKAVAARALTKAVAKVVAEIALALEAVAGVVVVVVVRALWIGVRCDTCVHVTLADFWRVGSVPRMLGMPSHDCCSSETGCTQLKSRSGYAPRSSDSIIKGPTL